MQAVILAAGRGTRMGELANNTSKLMLRVLGKPILEHKLEQLPEAIMEVIFVIGHQGEQIKNYFGDAWSSPTPRPSVAGAIRAGGRKIIYVEQKELNGTGGAIFLLEDLVVGKFLVLMGDDLNHPEDLQDLLEDEVAILAYEVEHLRRLGSLEVDEHGHLKSVVENLGEEKQEGGLVNTATYVLNQDFFRYPLVPISETEYGLPQALTLMAKDYPVKVRKARAWLAVNKPEDLKRAEEFLTRSR